MAEGGREVLYRRWIGSSGLRRLLCPFWFLWFWSVCDGWDGMDGMDGCDY